MKLFAAELHKLLKNRFCLGCLGALVLVNLFLLWTGVRPLAGRAPASAYRQMAQDLHGLPAPRQLALVEDRLRQTTALYRIDQIVRTEAMDPKGGALLRQQNADLFSEYGELYAAGGFLSYAPTLAQEYLFLTEIQQECAQVAGYDGFLDEIEEKAALLSQISIFAASDGNDYAQQNIHRTAAAYEGMRGRAIDYAPQKGLMTALDFVWTDVVALFAMLAFASALVRDERDGGMLALVRSTPGGRLRTALAKLAALAAGMLGILLLLYGVNLLYCGSLYGLGGLGRSIQSVPALMRSTLKVNVAEYLALFLLSKWAAAFLCGAWVLWTCLVAKRPLTGYGAALLLPALSLLVRALVPATSRWNVLKYANLASLLKNNELLGGYRNLYWFGGPVQLPLVELVAALLFGGCFISLFCFAFARAQLLPARRRATVRRTRKRAARARGLLPQEGYKAFILCGAAAVLLGLGGFQMYQAAVSENFINAQEIYYARYMRRLAGPVTMEKLEWLQTEGQKFRPLLLAQQGLAQGTVSPQQYQDIMVANYGLQQEYGVYQQVVGKLYYIKAHPGAYFIYDSGYPKLFDHADTRDVQDVLLTGLALSMACCGLFAMEHATGMRRVVRATPLGRTATLAKKVGIGSGISAAVTLLVLAPRVWQVGCGYGFSAPTAPLYSLTEYADAPASIPVFMLMFASLLARLIAGWSMAMTVLALSQRMKNQLYAALTGSVLLCLPSLLSVYGLTQAKWFSFYPLFHFGAMMQRTDTAVAAWLCLALFLCLGLFCLYDLWDQWE